MKLTIYIILAVFIHLFQAQATKVTIDVRDLSTSTSFYISEGGVLNKIPDKGIVELEVSNLPTIINIKSINKGKVITHKSIWLKENELKISGSIINSIDLYPLANGELLADDIHIEWEKVDLKKNSSFIPTQAFLVYLSTKIGFKEAEFIHEVLAKVPKKDKSFWATRTLENFLEEFENVGFNPSTKNFDHLTGMNRRGEKEKFNRPENKYLLLDFSSSGCRPCLIDIDKLVELQKDFKNDLEILSIWDDPTQEAWLNIAKKQKEKVSWISLRDDSKAIFQKFEIDVYPTYILIGPDGKITKRWRGAGIEKTRRYLAKKQ